MCVCACVLVCVCVCVWVGADACVNECVCVWVVGRVWQVFVECVGGCGVVRGAMIVTGGCERV